MSRQKRTFKFTYKALPWPANARNGRQAKSARCLELSPMKSGTAFGALAGLFRTPTVAATLHDPSGAESSRLVARFTIVFFALPATVAPQQP